MARRPDAEYPTLHPVVEGSDGQFTITFKEGQYNLDRGGFAQVYIGHDQTGRKLALKCPLTKPSLGDEADQERVRPNDSAPRIAQTSPCYSLYSAC